MCFFVFLLGSLAIFGGEIDTVPPGCTNPTKKKITVETLAGSVKKLGLSENGGYPPQKKNKVLFKWVKSLDFGGS